MAAWTTSDVRRFARGVAGVAAAFGSVAALGLAASSLLLVSPAARAAQVTLSTENVKQAETEAGDLVADAVRGAGGADIAFVPAAAFKPGATAPRPANAEQAAGLMEPATDAVVVLSLRGTQVLAALERAVSFAPQSSSGFLQVSGLKFAYDASKPGGKRVVSATVGGSPLDAVKTYKVATTRPLANGQQGYFQIWDKDQITADPGKTLAAALADLARQRGGTLTGSVEGRITEAGR